MDNNVCRTCLKTSTELLPLFDDDTNLPHKIKTISSIEVSLDDDLPNKICVECIGNINLSYNFQKVIVNSDIELKYQWLLFIKQDKFKNDNNIDEESKNDVKLIFVANDDDVSNLPLDILIKSDVTEVELKKGSSIVAKNIRVSRKKNTRNVVNMRNYWNVKLKRKSHKCDKCDFQSSDRNRYRTHLQSHMTRMCPICGKFISALNIIKHVNTHTEPPVSCKECGKICKNSGSLRAHMLDHKGINRTCKICGEMFTVRKAYVRHFKSHKSKEEKRAKCLLCDKVLCDKEVLKRHMRSHTGERPFPCEFCKKGFSSSNALKTHKRQHTNERPYKCALCSTAFPQRVSLRTHLRSKHQMGTIDNVFNGG